MTPLELERYLHQYIPLSQAMQVSVVAVEEDQVVLAAPLAPNINQHETVFGGSESAIAILAAWSMLHQRLHGRGMNYRLVIQRNTMEYLLPVTGDFRAVASAPSTEDWDGFVRMLHHKGRGRLTVHSVIEFEGRIAGRLEGEFVALGVTPA